MFFASAEFQAVVSALNEGFLKTVQLFFVTLIGALPWAGDLLWIYEPLGAAGAPGSLVCPAESAAARRRVGGV